MTRVLIFAAFLVLATAGRAAAEPPDLTGIWTFLPDPNASRSAFMALWPKDAPFTEEGRKKVGEYRALVEPAGDNPGGFCLGYGMPASMLSSGGYPMEIIQRPEQITIVYQAHTEVRRIYMDGRVGDPKTIFPSRGGHSVGRWDGETLVVETTRLYEAVDQASAHSEEAKVTERYRVERGADGLRILVAELTLEDPRFYTAPVSVMKKWLEKGNGRMMEYECNEAAWEDHLEQLRAKAAAENSAAGE